MLQLKRVYEPPSNSDGKRILIDRLWPRGLSKARGTMMPLSSRRSCERT
ncbi:MAG TPA: DUF488 family protein [Gemmatimonadaceae bacterium]